MKKGLIICSVLVVVQLVLIILVYQRGREEGPALPTGPLLTVDLEGIELLELEDRDGRSLVFNKEQGLWRLPASADLPADGLRIQQLLERIGSVQRGWPEATTVEAAVRFRVAADHFERKLTLHGEDGTRQVWYFGVSPGIRRMYVRVDGDPEIYSLQLLGYELEALADAWIEPSLLHLEAEQVKRVELPGLTLERRNETLQPIDLDQGEEVRKDRLDSLIHHLTRLSVIGVVDLESRAGLALDDSFFSYRLVLQDGSAQDYVWYRPVTAEPEEEALLAETSPVLRISGSEQLFRVAAWQVEDIAGISRNDLVQPQGEGNALPAMEVLDPSGL
ncbi:DUF4340 domain-containing protein [Desulfobulbus alkaliphilus]|uniref:DUF4340 domain-containing protein n=1 Tax=Desulfobulbus alkaliphilus TaxID=869814 RepID=UPI0019667598|nr:DUF4340 domain-containing protein [Desulfobulbus alkaliphilus]MBM9537765.1 DUF4340 domain-containing protein [Desulfobulbus alkaliphilus]